MKQETENLLKVSSYAREMGISSTWVYKLAKAKKIEIITIDGVQFIDSEKY